MNTLLLFVPEVASCDLPYLSLPCLTAYLKSRGYRAAQIDLNMEFMNYFLGPRGVEELKTMARERFMRLEKQSSLNALEQRAYAKLAWPSLTPLKEIHTQTAWIKNVFKSNAFYSLKKFNRAKRILDRWRNVLEGILVEPGETVPPGVYRYYDSSEMLIRIVETPERNPFEKFFRMVLPSIKAAEPDLIGFSMVMPSQILPVLTLGKILKVALPDTLLVAGGNICTRLADVLPHSPSLFRYFDMVIVKEGEKPLAALVDQLSNHLIKTTIGPQRMLSNGACDLSKVPNLIYRQEGKIFCNPLDDPEDINNLPAPDFDGLPLDEYYAPKRALPLYSSKGCYWGRCAFCNIHVGYTRFRSRKTKLVLEDMAKLYECYGAEIINFVDEAMPLPNLRGIAEGLITRGLDIDWNAYARMEHFFTPELCTTLRRGGCTALYFGLEGGNPRIHTLMCRGIDLPNAPQILENVHSAGIITHVNIILGFPGEKENEAYDSINFLLHNKENIDSAFATSFILGRWSPVARNPEQWGVTISPIEACDLALFFQDYQIPAEGLSPRQADELKWKAWEQFNREYPFFGLKDFEESLPYAVRYFKTTDRMELLHLCNTEQEEHRDSEQHLKNTTIGPQTNVEEWNEENSIYLKQGVQLITLAHDYPRIRRLLAYPLDKPDNIQSTPINFLYNTLQDYIFKLSPRQFRMLKVMIDKSPPEAKTDVAREFGIAPEKAYLLIKAFSRLANKMVHIPNSYMEVKMK